MSFKTKIRFENVSKMFGNYVAVQDLDFEVNDTSPLSSDRPR